MKRTAKQVFAFLLVVAMSFSMAPVNVFANTSARFGITAGVTPDGRVEAVVSLSDVPPPGLEGMGVRLNFGSVADRVLAHVPESIVTANPLFSLLVEPVNPGEPVNSGNPLELVNPPFQLNLLFMSISMAPEPHPHPDHTEDVLLSLWFDLTEAGAEAEGLELSLSDYLLVGEYGNPVETLPSPAPAFLPIADRGVVTGFDFASPPPEIVFPSPVPINEQLEFEMVTTNLANGEFALDVSPEPPEWLNVPDTIEIVNNTGTLVLTGDVPAEDRRYAFTFTIETAAPEGSPLYDPEEPAIISSATTGVFRFIVGDPPTLELDPDIVIIDDDNLRHTVTVGGTATGAITFERGDLPSAVSLSAPPGSNTITVSGRRPNENQESIVGEYVVTVIRREELDGRVREARATLEIEVNLTPDPDGGDGFVLFGDATNDGVVDGQDVLLMRRWAAGWGDEDDAFQLRGPGANVNNDAVIDGGDVLRIRRWAAGWGDEDPQFDLPAPGVPEVDFATISAGHPLMRPQENYPPVPTS